MFQSQRFFVGAVGLLIFGALIFVLIRDTSGNPEGATTTPTVDAANSPNGGTFFDGTPGADAALDGQAQMPFLKRQPVFSADTPHSVRASITSKIKQIQAKLSISPYDPPELLNLAMQFKTAGDYQTAREIWEFMASKSPKDPIPHQNLGELYQHYLNDFRLSEEAFLRGIAADGTFAQNYLSLHELYRYSYKQDTSAAVDILILGVSRVSMIASIDMYAALGDYYLANRDKDNAIKYYASARDAAKSVARPDQVERFDALIKQIRESN